MMPSGQRQPKRSAEEESGFSKCYDRLFSFGLSLRAFVVYMTLKSFDFGEEKGVVWPKVPTIATKANCPPTAVRKALRELERAGLISTQRRPNKSNRYVLHDIDEIPTPLPAASKNQKSLPADRSNRLAQASQIDRSGPVKSTVSGPVESTAEADKEKRSRPSTEKQTQEADEPTPPPAGSDRHQVAAGVGCGVGAAAGCNDHPALVSEAKDPPQPTTDFLSLRQRLERHTQ